MGYWSAANATEAYIKTMKMQTNRMELSSSQQLQRETTLNSWWLHVQPRLVRPH
ncbi:hypothetical protein Hanom_Chr12g01129321 [Helianthus anomalus]